MLQSQTSAAAAAAILILATSVILHHIHKHSSHDINNAGTNQISYTSPAILWGVLIMFIVFIYKTHVAIEPELAQTNEPDLSISEFCGNTVCM
jgi:hypothetical protein